MKRTDPLWGSISILIGVVIAILALVRGVWATVLLLCTFAMWGAWVILTQLIPAWSANRTYRRRISRLKKDGVTEDDTGRLLVCHVNHRISEHLKAAYPNVQWEWAVPDPARLIEQGGIGRIRVYGVPDHDLADITLSRNGTLQCTLLTPVEGTQQEGPVKPDPQVWYELQGRRVMEALIADLNSRGHSSLMVNVQGKIVTHPGGGREEVSRNAFAEFPKKDLWPRLAQVLEQEGLHTDVRDQGLLVSW